MTNRRQFLKTASIASAAVVLPSFAATSEVTPILTPSKIRKPIVLSTWNFGLQANAAAWEVLKNNGKALDAVEAGVKVPEGDPNQYCNTIERIDHSKVLEIVVKNQILS